MNEDKRSAEELKQRIADLRSRMPKHSVPPAMLIELEDLEEALEQTRADAREEDRA